MSSNLVTDAHDLKLRLEWGQPGFTIVDVRDRHTYNYGHITGAIQIPVEELAQKAKTSLHKQRHIYIYGVSDEQATHAVQLLKDSGFADVAVIPGGLAAWKNVGGPTEGVAA